MRRLTLGLLLAGLLALSPFHAEANEGWRDHHLTLPEALNEGYKVVSTYYNSAGHLVFVLQLNHVLLLCQFSELQNNNCAQLNTQ